VAYATLARWSYEQFGFTVISAPVGFLSGANRRPTERLVT